MNYKELKNMCETLQNENFDEKSYKCLVEQEGKKFSNHLSFFDF